MKSSVPDWSNWVFRKGFHFFLHKKKKITTKPHHKTCCFLFLHYCHRTQCWVVRGMNLLVATSLGDKKSFEKPLEGKDCRKGFWADTTMGWWKNSEYSMEKEKKDKKNPRIKHKKSLYRAFKNSKCFSYMLGPKGISLEEMHLNGTLRTTSWEQFYTTEHFMFFCQKADLHVTCTQQSNFYATFHCAFYPKAEMASKLSL